MRNGRERDLDAWSRRLLDAWSRRLLDARSRSRSTPARSAAAVALAAAIAYGAIPAHAQYAASGPLRIASWDLSAAELPPPPPKPDFRPEEVPRPAWRTTFGSERRTVQRVPFKGAVTIDADIVMLQGVADVAAVRRLFPAWHWRLIVSRHVLPTHGAAGGHAGGKSGAPVTAIAVRARQGLRITGRDELRELRHIEEDVGSAPAAVTAVRVADGQRALWMVSAALPDACAGKECPARAYLSAWRQRKRDAGEATVLGGGLSDADKTAPCPRQSIEADGKTTSDPQLGAKGTLSDKPAGCMATLDLPPW